jgi:hypothetical protein
LKVLLYLIAFLAGPFLVAWIYNTVSKLVIYYKYLHRLNKLAPKVSSIKLSVAEKEFARLNSLANSTFSKLKKEYNVSTPEEPPSIGDFIEADEEIQKEKQRSRRSDKRTFRRRDRR